MNKQNEIVQDKDRPDICIGTEGIHTPDCLIDYIIQGFQKYGYEVGANTPYGGAFVPNQFFGDGRVWSIMIEINRKLYIDEQTGEKWATFNVLKQHIKSVVEGAEQTLL